MTLARRVWWSLSAPFAVACAALVALLVASIPAERFLVKRAVADRVAAAEADLRQDVTVLGVRLRAAEAAVKRVADEIGLVATRPSAQLLAEFGRRTEEDSMGAFAPARRFDYRTGAGIWAPRGVDTPDGLRLVYAAAALALEAARPLADSTIPRLWVLPSDGGEITLAPSDSTYFARGLAGGTYLGTEWLERTRPRERAAGGPLWLEPYRAEPAAVPVVPVAVPLTIAGRWRGSVGADASVRDLFAEIGRFVDPARGNFGVYAASGQVVYIPGWVDRRTRFSLVPEDVDRLFREAVPEHVARIDQGDRIDLLERIRGTPWLAIANLNRAGLEAGARDFVVVARAALLVVLLAVLGTGLWAGHRDRDFQRAVDLELVRTGERFERLFHLLPDGLTLTNGETSVIHEVNEGFCRLSGFARSELIGRTPDELGLWADPTDRRRAMEAIRRTGSVVMATARLRRKDGATRDCLYTGRPVEIEGVPFLLSVVHDVTEQRRLEQQFVHAQKMEAVGRLAGGIAHDFNNIITAIAGNASLLLRRIPEGDPAREDVEDILRSSQRAADLTRQLLGFARRQMVQPRVVDLGQLVRESERFLSRLIGEDVALSVTTHGQPALVRIDPGQFEQVLVNLAVNARDAMPRGGRLEVDVDLLGGRVHVTVTDTGTGMTDEVRAHIFEPFFTTKAPGKGTGLGLSTCYGIVRQAGGEIEVQSTVGKGTSIRVILPALAPDDGPKRGRVAAVESPAREPRAATILVVEDEPIVGQIIRRALTEAGYRVLEARSGEAALERYGDRVGEIDLVVTDVVMPGMSGLDLVTRLRQRRADLAVLFVSGYSEERLTLPNSVSASSQFLGKPFRPEELVQRVDDQLRRVAPRGSPAEGG